MVGSGSEPTYLPLTNTSCAGLELYDLDAANALEAVAITRATARAVLVNMVVSPAGLSVTPVSGVRAHLELTRWCGESPGGPETGHHSSGIKNQLGEWTTLKIKDFRPSESTVAQDA
jgi:hypothetical protein